MTYVIAEPCVNTKDTACVEVCPVDCIHPKKDEPEFEAETKLYIDPRDLHRLRRVCSGLPGPGHLPRRGSAGEVAELHADGSRLVREA